VRIDAGRRRLLPSARALNSAEYPEGREATENRVKSLVKFRFPTEDERKGGQSSHQHYRQCTSACHLNTARFLRFLKFC
jgi:hypothetical protein